MFKKLLLLRQAEPPCFSQLILPVPLSPFCEVTPWDQSCGRP